MNRNHLILLILIVALSAVLFVRKANHTDVKTGSAAGDLVLPALDVNRIERIRIRGPQQTVELARAGGRWKTMSRYGYPADFVKLSETVRQLSELTIGQVVHGGTELAQEYGVDTNQPADATRSVQLFDEKDNRLAEVILGAYREVEGGMMGSYPDGRFIRSDELVALVDENLRDAEAGPARWIQRDLLDVQPTPPFQITVRTTHESYTLSKTNDTFTLSGLKNNERLESSAADRLAGALSKLSCRDIADPDLSDEALGLDRPAVYTLTTHDGFIYRIQTAQGGPDDQTAYARIFVDFEPANKPDDEEEGAASIEREKRYGRLKQRLAGWTFIIDNYTRETLAMPKSELVEIIDEET